MIWNWDLSKYDWDRRKHLISELHNDYLGNCRAGEVCFDIIIRADEDHEWISYDCYVGGIDDGYGDTLDGYPYSYTDGGDFDDLLEGITFDEFKRMAEERFKKFIWDADLVDDAEQPLHIW